MTTPLKFNIIYIANFKITSVNVAFKNVHLVNIGTLSVVFLAKQSHSYLLTLDLKILHKITLLTNISPCRKSRDVVDKQGNKYKEINGSICKLKKCRKLHDLDFVSLLYLH